jgi:hypothetical protein
MATYEAPHPRGLARLRFHAGTTPARLRAGVVAVVVLAIAFALAAAAATFARQRAVDQITTRTEPLLVGADGLYASLSDADATAATTFLIGGIEPTDRRARYLADLDTASRELATLSEQAGTSGVAQQAVDTIARNLPVYAGLIEAARADNRQGLPIGTAYLRAASAVMFSTILPAAERLYEVEARGLVAQYRNASSTGTATVVMLAAGLLVATLVIALVYVAVRTRRFINVGLALAMVTALAGGAIVLDRFAREQDALAAARSSGSDPVQVLSATRILALRAEADESLALVARGGGDRYATDFTTVLTSMSSSSGILAYGAALAARTGTSGQFRLFQRALAQYWLVHDTVDIYRRQNDFNRAIAIAVGTDSTETVLGDRMNADLEAQITGAQQRFHAAASSAASDLDQLWLPAAVTAAAIAILASLGLFRRINEYR